MKHFLLITLLPAALYGMDQQQEIKTFDTMLPNDVQLLILAHAYDIENIDTMPTDFAEKSFDYKISYLWYAANNLKTFNESNQSSYTLADAGACKTKINQSLLGNLYILHCINARKTKTIKHATFKDLQNIPFPTRAKILHNNSNVIVDSSFSARQSFLNRMSLICSSTMAGAIGGAFVAVKNDAPLFPTTCAGALCGLSTGLGLSIPPIYSEYERNSTPICKSLLNENELTKNNVAIVKE